MLRDMLKFVIISLSIKIKKPIKIEINSILKKFSFRLNFAEYPITINPKIIKKNGLVISER